jgi:mono/diheme cytochrome c family protein
MVEKYTTALCATATRVARPPRRPRPHDINLRTILVAAGILAASSAGLAQALDVKTLWANNCAQCHGVDGKGLTKMGKKLKIRDLTDSKVQADLVDEQMQKNIKEGVKDATGKFRMKPAENVSDAEINALVNYVRTLKAR